jgi:hypothetical protein
MSARVAPSVLSVATVGSTASRAPGSSTAAKRTDAHSQQLRLSVIAARFAKELHFAHTAYYRPEELPYRPDHEQEQDWVERVWRGVSNVERVALIQQAADLLLELAPDLCPKCTQAYVAKGSDFCSVQCSIDAENNR